MLKRELLSTEVVRCILNCGDEDVHRQALTSYLRLFVKKPRTKGRIKDSKGVAAWSEERNYEYISSAQTARQIKQVMETHGLTHFVDVGCSIGLLWFYLDLYGRKNVKYTGYEIVERRVDMGNLLLEVAPKCVAIWNSWLDNTPKVIHQDVSKDDFKFPKQDNCLYYMWDSLGENSIPHVFEKIHKAGGTILWKNANREKLREHVLTNKLFKWENLYGIDCSFYLGKPV